MKDGKAGNAWKVRTEINYRDASMRGIGDFASGDQLTQLDRGRTESPASWTAAGLRVLHEAIFGDAEHRGINLNFFEMKNALRILQDQPKSPPSTP